jgi:hypothetical protein
MFMPVVCMNVISDHFEYKKKWYIVILLIDNFTVLWFVQCPSRGVLCFGRLTFADWYTFLRSIYTCIDFIERLYLYIIIFVYYLETLIGWKRVTWRSITRGSAHWACIAHLTLEWYWNKFQREIIITLKNSSHLEWRVGLTDTILKGTHPGTIYARFGLYIDASCQAWLHLTKLFQRRRFA